MLCWFNITYFFTEVRMLWVIFYCGLISFVVSARPINNTSLTDATASNNSDTRLVTKKWKGTSNADHARKDCVFQIEENDITNIVERTENDLVNIVDFHFFKGTSQNDKLFEDVQIALVTLVGREILLILDEKRYSIVALTLNAGRENLNVHFKNVSLTNCTKQHVAASMLEQIVLRNKNPRNYEICYAERRVKQTDRMCCRITDTDSTNFKYECSKKDSFLQKSAFSLILTILMIGTLPFLFWILLPLLLWYSLGKIYYDQYYKLEESTMSPIRFFVKMVWKEQDLIPATFIRKCVIILALYVNGRLCIIYATSDTYLWVLFVPTVPGSFGILLVLYLDRFKLSEIATLTDGQLFEFWLSRSGSVDLLKLASQPRRRLTRLNKLFIFAFSPLFLVFYLSLFILELTIILGYGENNKKYFCRDFFLIVDTVISMALYIFQFHISYILTFAVQSLLLGLFLNLAYFLPYLTAISVFTFYGHGIWKSVEEKFFLLKLLIYEECQEKKAKFNEINGTPQKDQKLVSVVPKKIYDTIREKLLPYSATVSWAVIKLLWLFVFSYGILELVRMLHTFNTTAGIKVMVTASVGILPRIFSTITWNAGGEEREEAWKKDMKLNLKRMIKAIPDDEIVLSIPMMIQLSKWTQATENPQITSTPISDSDTSDEDLQNGIRYVYSRFICTEVF